MKQKGIRRGICTVLTLLICLQSVFSFGDTVISVYAAAPKVKFASSIRSSVKKAAETEGADITQIAVAKVVNYTNIFSQPEEKGTLKGRLYRGAAAYIIRTKGDFCYISSGKLTGWAKRRCLVTGTEAVSLMKSIKPRVATVKSATLNVRSSASTGARMMGELKKGDKMIVTSLTKKWAKVRLTNSDYGYIYRKYAKIENGLFTGVTVSEEKQMKELLKESASKNQDPNKKNDNGNTETKTDTNNEEETETEAETKADLTDGDWVCLGEFKLTAYCPCAKCNGAGNAGKTATGAEPLPDHTIAVDRRVIPLHSEIKIEGRDPVYVAEDTGVSGKTIDILFSTHEEALAFGVQYRDVYIRK